MAGNQDTFQNAMNSGHTAAWDQKWEQACEFYKSALLEFPDNPVALTSLGLALYEQQQFSESLHCYQHAARVAPNDPLPLEKMGRIFERQGKIPETVQVTLQAAELYLKAREVEKAIENYSRVTSLQPENQLAHSRLAIIYDRLGRKQEAVTKYLALASLLQHTGDMAKALQLVEYCLQIRPDSKDARQALAMLRMNQPLPRPLQSRVGTGPIRMPKVQTHAVDETTTDDRSPDPITEARQKAIAQLASLMFEQSEEMVITGQGGRRNISALTRGNAEKNDEQDEKVKALLLLSQAIEAQSQGQDDIAVVAMERALRAGLSHPAVFFDLGYLSMKSDHVKALHYFQQASPNRDFNLASNLLNGKLYLEDGNMSGASAAYLQAMKIADLQTTPEAQIEELQQNYEPILEAQNTQTDPIVQKNLISAIGNMLERPNWRQSIKTARQQLGDRPTGGGAVPLATTLIDSRSTQVIDTLDEVRKLAGQNMVRSAMEEAFYALKFAPTYLPTHVQIGELLLQEGRTQDAVSKFLVVAELYSLRGEASQASRLLTRLVKISPMDLSVRQRLIEALTSEGQMEQAIQQTMEMADIYTRLADFDQARQTFLAALKISQLTHTERAWGVEILNKVADIDMQRLDWRQAVRIFEQIRTLEPGDGAARRQLIDLNFRLNQDAAALAELDSFTNHLENNHNRLGAIEFINDLLKEQGNRLDLRQRLAEQYQRDCQVIQAVAVLDAVADEMLDLGQKENALNVMANIIAMNPPNVQDYQKALEKLRKVG
jgi:tetratricopeptide (TPR) repeat protein